VSGNKYQNIYTSANPILTGPKTQWVRYMHGINRLSILLFLLALVILAIKLLSKS
jgi:hypothetical protein